MCEIEDIAEPLPLWLENDPLPQVDQKELARIIREGNHALELAAQARVRKPVVFEI